MSTTEHLLPRHAQRSVSAALADTRVVVLNGARQRSTPDRQEHARTNRRGRVPWIRAALAVLESAAGEVVACEVKAAETVRSEDFRGIQRLARRLGDQLVAGVVLYAGSQPLPFGDRLRAWPILWTLIPDVRGK